VPKIITAAMPTTNAPPPEPEWQEQTLVFRLPNQHIITEDGWRYGELFVHGALPGEMPERADLVVVSHVATRLAVLRVKEVEDAIAGAEILWTECRGAWRYCDDVDVTKIPDRIREWVRECNRQQKLVPLCRP